MAIDLIVKKKITITATASKVWEVLTEPEWIKQYLMGTIVKSDWKAGSPILFTGTWQGKEYADKGVIQKLEAGKILQYTYWSGWSGLPDAPENYSMVTYELSSDGTETTLTLTQDHFANETQYGHSDKNWETVLKTIKDLVENKWGANYMNSPNIINRNAFK